MRPYQQILERTSDAIRTIMQADADIINQERVHSDRAIAERLAYHAQQQTRLTSDDEPF